MNFTKKYITPVYLSIVDIGSYKIRISACKFLNKKVTILWYTEKRQSTSTFSNGECSDLPTLCEDILDAIKRLENEHKVLLESVVINFPFGELFAATKKINYKRDIPGDPLEKEELEQIILRAQEISLKKLSDEIYDMSGMTKEEIELILSRIHSFKIDGEVKKNVIGEIGQNVRISLLNVFIPLGKYNLIQHIGNIIEKKIMRTLPSEFCLTKLFSEKSIIVMSIGATQTSISLKKEWELIWISKINIWINDLLIKISEKTWETYKKVLQNIDSSSYGEEKKSFLSIWTQAVLVGIKDIIWEEICPNTIALFWGWGNNTFIKEALENLVFEKYDIRIVKKLVFVSPELHQCLDQIEPVSHNIVPDIHLDSLALILETNYILGREKDTVSQSLKKVIQKLGYTSS